MIGWMQVRIGPNRVTFFGIRWLGGLAQPIADGLKLLMKEIIIPTGANKGLFVLAPILAIAPALAAWAVMPFRRAGAGQHQCRPALSSWRSPRWACTASSSRAGRPIPSMPFSARCVRRRRWCPTKSPWASRWSCVLMAAQSLNLVEIVACKQGSYGLLQLVLDPAVPDVRRLPDFRRGRNQPRAVRRGRGRIGNRRRLPCRIFGHGLRGVLPRRIRQHDPGRDADLADVPRRLAVAVRLARFLPDGFRLACC